MVATSSRSRMIALALVVALHAVVGWLLLRWRGDAIPAMRQAALEAFDLRPEPPPPPPPPAPREKGQRAKDAPAPPNLKQVPTPIVAPVPIIRLPVPPPIITAPIASTGNAVDAGAAAIAGPGTGAGGEGQGTGGGGDGEGGDDAEGFTPPRQIRGRLRNSDFIRSDEEAGVSRRVGVRYLVQTDGRVTECEVTRPSGNAALDANTCRLIIERFRFRPSRDRQGRPVPSYVVENHGWYVEEP